MDIKVRDLPEELIPHIATIKEIAKKYGVDQIRLYAYVEADLPWDTARIKLHYYLPKDIDESALTEEITQKVGIATYITNINRMSEPIRTYAIEEFNPL